MFFNVCEQNQEGLVDLVIMYLPPFLANHGRNGGRYVIITSLHHQIGPDLHNFSHVR